MKSFVSADNTLEVVMGVPEHREPMIIKAREIEGFTLAYREEWPPDGYREAVQVVINLVFKK